MENNLMSVVAALFTIAAVNTSGMPEVYKFIIFLILMLASLGVILIK